MSEDAVKNAGGGGEKKNSRWSGCLKHKMEFDKIIRGKCFWVASQHGLIRHSWTLLVFNNLRHVCEARLMSTLHHFWWEPLEVNGLQHAKGHSAGVALHPCWGWAHHKFFSANCRITGGWAAVCTIGTSPALCRDNDQTDCKDLLHSLSRMCLHSICDIKNTARVWSLTCERHGSKSGLTVSKAAAQMFLAENS